MHITERLGLNSGRPVTAAEAEILSAYEMLFIEEDFLFLRCGPTITLTSDFGITIVSVPRADRFGATVKLVMVPSSVLSPAQIKNVISVASAAQEGGQKLLVIERPAQPLIIVSEVELQRPYGRDDLSRVFGDFASNTDMALGEAMREGPAAEQFAESVGLGRSMAGLRY
jgi:hypothetical protein